MKLAALVALLCAGCPKGSDNKKTIEPQLGSSLGSDAGRQLLPNDAAGAAAIALPPSHPLPEVPLGLPPVPADVTPSPEALALGELVFWDGRLASDGKTACATCHDPAHGYSSIVGPGDRRGLAWPLANAAWRSRTIAAELPAHATKVLGNDLAAAADRLNQIPLYAAHLARIGGAPADALARALTAYVWTRYDGDAPWDRQERLAVANDPVATGYKIFTGKAQCAQCHTPPLYSDLRPHGGYPTPSLRGAAVRPAYFHDASATSLAQALDQHPTTEMKKVALTPAEKTALTELLRALSAPAPAPVKPVLP